MRNIKRVFISCVLAAFFVALLGGVVISSENVTIEGVVSDTYQILTDEDEAYDILESEKGQELMEMVGKRVKVTGMVEEEEGVKAINVAAYEVIEE